MARCLPSDVQPVWLSSREPTAGCCALQVPAQALQQLVDAMLAACSSIVGIVHMVEVPPPPRQGRQRGQRPSAAALKPALGEQGALSCHATLFPAALILDS